MDKDASRKKVERFLCSIQRTNGERDGVLIRGNQQPFSLEDAPPRKKILGQHTVETD